MTTIPELKFYSVEKLTALGNCVQDVFLREEIKELMTDKILELDSPMFFLLNKFMNSSKILHEVYARVILIRLRDEEFSIDDTTIDEILSLVSLEDLALYGANACSLKIREKCNRLFWSYAVTIEDTSELNRKNVRYRRKMLVNNLRKER